MSLWDMSRHADLLEQGYKETVEFLNEQDVSDGADRDLEVQAEQDKEATAKTREAAPPEDRIRSDLTR